MSLNLHSIVRGSINAVNADEDCYLIQSGEQTNHLGKLETSFKQAEKIKAQIQSLSGDDLQIIDNDTLRTEIDRKFFLFADTSSGEKPSGIIRPLGKSGDFIYRPAEKSYWKIFNVSEDFTSAGWVLVFASMQVQVPAAVKAQIEELQL